MRSQSSEGRNSFWGELALLRDRGFQVWHTIPRRLRWSLGGAALLMTLASASGVLVPLLIGKLIDGVQSRIGQPGGPHVLFRFVSECLAAIAGLIILREVLHVIRRYLVESTCTRIDKHLCVKTVSHLLRVELAHFTHEKVGALHGRIFRSIDGYMRVLRLSFLDFFPRCSPACSP